jgi:hypothetical protein
MTDEQYADRRSFLRTGAIGTMAAAGTALVAGASSAMAELPMAAQTMVDSSAYGITPATADCGPLIAKIPKYVEVWFSPGTYTFKTYPTQKDFSNVFYRSTGAIWKCVTPKPDWDPTPVFNWIYVAPQNFGVYPHGGNARDMTQAGISPIEGIGIIGSGSGNWGTGIAFGQGTAGDNYFFDPHNFSVGGFYIGVGFLAPLSNCFQNGIRNVVLKNNNNGIIIDNTGSTNSGEQFRITDCHIGGNISDGIATYGVQKLTVVGTSLDYNHRQMYVSSTATVELIGCYFEQHSTSTPGETIAIDTSATLMIQGGTMYGLPFSPGNIVRFLSTTSNVWFNNVGIFDSGGRAYINPMGGNVHGTIIGCNGVNTPPALKP